MKTAFLILALLLSACGGLDTAVAPDAATGATIDAGIDTGQSDTRMLLTCGPGTISIAADCEVLTKWKCQIPTELWRVPCVVPNLNRLLVADCSMCAMYEPLAGEPTQ